MTEPRTRFPALSGSESAETGLARVCGHLDSGTSAGEVIEGVVIALDADGVRVCPHDDETRREFVPGRGPRLRCCRCGGVVAGVPEPRALGGRR